MIHSLGVGREERWTTEIFRQTMGRRGARRKESGRRKMYWRETRRKLNVAIK